MDDNTKPLVVTSWETGNEAIHARIDRQRPWCGTVFSRPRVNDAADLVAMTFGETIEEAMERAAMCALAPRLAALAGEMERAFKLADKIACHAIAGFEISPDVIDELAFTRAALAKFQEINK